MLGMMKFICAFIKYLPVTMNFIVPSYLYVSATQATVLRILYTTWKDLVARGIKISQTCVMVQWIYDMRITYNVLIYLTHEVC